MPIGSACRSVRTLRRRSPSPVLFRRQAGEQIAVALEQLGQGVQKQRLAKAARARQKVVGAPSIRRSASDVLSTSSLYVLGIFTAQHSNSYNRQRQLGH